MVDPIQGEYQKIQAEHYAQNPKKYKEEELKEASKIDPKKDAIALAFMKMWGWPAEKALAAQKTYCTSAGVSWIDTNIFSIKCGNSRKINKKGRI